MKIRKNKRMAAVVFLTGVLCMVYPLFSKYINNREAAGTTQEYKDMLERLSEIEKDNVTDELQAYGLVHSGGDEDYTLLADGNVIATIEIPKLKLNLPVYLGATEENLARGIAHIEGTSLPFGGESTHCVLAGHSGSSRHEWFSNINKLKNGDIFSVTSAAGTVSYVVTGTEVIEPYDTSKIMIKEGEDLMSLLTCTTPGVPNNKRLLVTGERV